MIEGWDKASKERRETILRSALVRDDEAREVVPPYTLYAILAVVFAAAAVLIAAVAL